MGRVVLDVQRFERAANGVVDLGRYVFIIVFGPFCMAYSLVAAGEVCLRGALRTKNWSERDLRRSCSLPTCIIRSGENVPLKALTIAAVDRFIHRGGACRLHAIFMNQLRMIWGYQEKLSSTGALLVYGSAARRRLSPEAVRPASRRFAAVAIDQAGNTTISRRSVISPFRLAPFLGVLFIFRHPSISLGPELGLQRSPSQHVLDGLG